MILNAVHDPRRHSLTRAGLGHQHRVALSVLRECVIASLFCTRLRQPIDVI